MNATIHLCALAGHRWHEADVSDTFPVLECERCHRRQKLADGTQRPEGWAERGGREQRASQLRDGSIQRRP